MPTQIQLRRGTAAQWTSANPTLASGELGVETDTGKIKVGSGSTAWTSLPYSGGGIGGSTTQVQYNNAGVFGGSANFVWDNSNVRLGIGTSSPSTSLHVVGSSSAITATVSSTSTTINGAPSLKVINTGSATTNQLAEIQFRYEDGTYNANGAIAALRESGTARGQSFIFAPSDSLGNATERMRLDSSGNLGLGVTPSAWGSGARAVQLGARMAVYNDGFNNALFANNIFFDGSVNKYIASEAAARYYLASDGTHIWQTAPSGTAGNNITFTERMRIDSAGNVGIGTSSLSCKLHVYGSNPGFRVEGDGGSYYPEIRLDGVNGSMFLTTYYGAMITGTNATGNNTIRFRTGGTTSSGAYGGSDRMLIDGVGRVWIGDAQPTTDAQFSATVENNNSNGIVVGVRGGIRAISYPGVNNSAAIYGTNAAFGTRYAVYGAITTNGYGSNYGGYFVSAGDATSECIGVYGETAQTDTNGPAVNSAFYAYAKATIGASNSGYSIGLYCRLSNYYKNEGVLVKSDYTGALTQNAIRFNRNGSDIGSITTTTTATAYNTSSDYRLKNSIAPMTGALAKVAQLKPVTYKWNLTGSDGEGFIAHELAEVCPHAVTGKKDEVQLEKYIIEEEEYEVRVTPAEFDADGNEITPSQNEKIVIKPAVMGEREVPVYQSIDTSFLVATLTAAVQELKAIVDAQAARIATLEGTQP